MQKIWYVQTYQIAFKEYLAKVKSKKLRPLEDIFVTK